MSKLIIELLQAKEPLFSASIRQLEQISGHPGADVRLQAEIIQKFHENIRVFGLDPANSSGEEIYQSLLNQAQKHDEMLSKVIGAEDPNSITSVLPHVIMTLESIDIKRDCWAIKKDVAEKCLLSTPPEKIIKHLGYKNVTELLKHEDVFEIYGALRFAETPEWLNNFNMKYKSLLADDFESRKIKLVVLDRKKWGSLTEEFIKKKRHYNTHSKEMGVVYILPPSGNELGLTTKLLALSLHYFNEIRLYSTFFKRHANQITFGQLVAETINANPPKSVILAGQHIHWRVIQRYFGKLDDKSHPEIFAPHLQPEDLHWRQAEEELTKLLPELVFWKDLDYVGLMYDGRPLTMNYIDVSLSFANSAIYDERYIYHFRESLWDELFARYMGQDVLKQQVLKQLDNALVKPEEIA